MYEAYYSKQTVLPQVTQMLSRCLKHCEIKYFITTLNQLSEQPTTDTAAFLTKIFRDKQNQPQSKGKKIITTPNNNQQAGKLSLN